MAMFGGAGPIDPGMSFPDDPSIQGAASGPVRSSGGMFGSGGVGRNIAGAIGDMLMARAGGQPMYMPMMQKQREMQMMMSRMGAQQQMQYQRELMLEQAKAQLRLQYPDGEFAQELIQGGIQPGTPEWTQAMHTRAQNSLDPVVITPQGPMLRSAIVNAPQAGQQAPQGVTFTPLGPGGPTQPASGGFRP